MNIWKIMTRHYGRYGFPSDLIGDCSIRLIHVALELCEITCNGVYHFSRIIGIPCAIIGIPCASNARNITHNCEFSNAVLRHAIRMLPGINEKTQSYIFTSGPGSLPSVLSVRIHMKIDGFFSYCHERPSDWTIVCSFACSCWPGNIYICLLWLISMLWHRQAIFESKGDKLPSSAECRIRTQGLRHLFASRLNACWQTNWAIEDQAKNLNSTARPYDQQVFSPLDLIASWLSHLALAIYMFVVVNFDALAQASDIRIERRQVAI